MQGHIIGGRTLLQGATEGLKRPGRTTLAHDVAMVHASLIKDYKKKLLAEKKAPTTINDHLIVLTGFFDYCIDNKRWPQ